MATRTKDRSTLKVEDVGPIERLTLQVPEDGGVVVLRGRNGVGKTKTLEAVESLVTNHGRLQARDGAVSGSVEGFGARINVSHKTTRKGELEVISLDSKWTIADVVDPKINDPAAADARRIKAIVSISGKGDKNVFQSKLLDPAEFSRIVPPEDLEGDDLTAIASRVKRRLEGAARAAEATVDSLNSKADGLRKAAGELAEEELPNKGKVEKELKEATEAEYQLRAERTAQSRAVEDIKQAQKEVEEAKRKWRSNDLPAASQKLEQAAFEQQQAANRIIQLREELRAAEQMEVQKREAVGMATDHLHRVKRQTAMIADLDAIATKPLPRVPSEEELQEAAKRTEAAKTYFELFVQIQEAHKQKAQAERVEDEAKSHAKEAEKLRDAAAAVDDILSEIVSAMGSNIRVKSGRLVMEGTKRGQTYFSDLSEGERYTSGIDFIVDTFPPDSELRPVIVIPQEAWQGLDPDNRKKINLHAKRRRVLILTAEPSADKNITSEVFGK